MRLRPCAFPRSIRCASAAIGVSLALGCSAVATTPDVRSCESALDCYAVSSADPFACWRCDKSVEGGTCVAGEPVASVRTLDLSGAKLDRVAAFTAARTLTVFAQQSPALGQSVKASPAVRFRGDLEREPVPLLSASMISQLAVAGDSSTAWCLGVDHRGESAGNLCLARCDTADCPRLCDTCGRATRPALAVQHCRAADGACEALAMYLAAERSAVGAKWILAGDSPRDLQLPAALDPVCAPVVLRAQRADQTRFVIAAAHSGAAEPWLGLVAAGGEPPTVYGLVPEATEHAQVLDLAGAAAEGDDAQGELLFAWIWSDGGAQHLAIARAGWSGSDAITPMSTVFELALSGEGRVSVAYAHYGPGASAGRVGEGGWVVAVRDGARAFALRIDRSRSQRINRPRELTGAVVGDFVVAPHPAGPESSSPFVYIDRVDMQARVLACKP